MVSFEEIQAAYYMVAATGVLVAAVFYIMNLRFMQKTKETETCRFLTDRMTSDPVMKIYGLLMQNPDWVNHDDFMDKYGYNNPEMLGHWTSWFFTAETLGYMIKNGLVKAETAYDLGAWGFIRLWAKYSKFILSRRETAWGRDYFSGFEYVASEMLKIKNQKDASFQGKLEEFRRTGDPNKN